MLPTKCRFIWLSGFRGEDFLEFDQSETRIACGGHYLLTNRAEMSNLYRGPSIDASYQVSVHLAKQFQRRFFRNQPIKNKNCLWRSGFLTDQDQMCNFFRGFSIDASYQVSVHLARWVQRRRLKCEKLRDDGRRTPSDGKSSHCLWQDQLRSTKVQTTIYKTYT